MPKEIFANMPKVKTLDIGRIKLTSLPEDSFKVCILYYFHVTTINVMEFSFETLLNF